MAGRTTINWTRVYMNGYDLSGYSRSIGPLKVSYDINTQACMSETVKGGLCGQLDASLGTLTGVFDTTDTVGLHVLTSATPYAAKNVLVAIGDRAEPAQGNPCFAGLFHQGEMPELDLSETMVNVTIPFGGMSPDAINYGRVFGELLHANEAENGANSAAGVEGPVGGSTAGAWMMWQILDYTGTGSAIITAEHCTTSGGVYAAITGLTSGSIAHTLMPCGGLAQSAVTETINRYVRWQIALTDLTSITFLLGFMRG